MTPSTRVTTVNRKPAMATGRFTSTYLNSAQVCPLSGSCSSHKILRRPQRSSRAGTPLAILMGQGLRTGRPGAMGETRALPVGQTEPRC